MKNTKTALVLGGGGQFGIAWELGYIFGLHSQGINLRKVDAIIGTSAGSQVGAVLASDWEWDLIWENQINLNTIEKTPQNNMRSVFKEYEKISEEAKTGEEWVKLLCEFSKEHKTLLNEKEHIQQIKNRFGKINWGKNLYITGTNIQNYKRTVWSEKDNIDIYKALSASSSLPGVWPPTNINNKLYSDGGSYSMENADLAINAEKTIIISPNLPVKTPQSLEDQINLLKQKNVETLSITPNQEVIQTLKSLGGNTVNPDIRKEIAEIAKSQGIQESKKIKKFINE